MAKVRRSIARKGKIPLNISVVDISGVTLLTAYTFSPKGGVITAISHIFITTIPNQIGLNPKFTMTG